MTHSTSSKSQRTAALLVAAAVLAVTVMGVRSATAARPQLQPDSAPARTSKRSQPGRYSVTGRTVLINRPRQEVYDFWRDAANLPQFMEDLESVEVLPSDDGTATGTKTRWTSRNAIGGLESVDISIVHDMPGEMIAWKSADGAMVDTRGKVTFSNAAEGRGTIVTAIQSHAAPGGMVGNALAKLWSGDPALQMRHALKRLKMLLETGEIATVGHDAPKT